MVPADEHDPHFRRISWTRINFGFTRNFTAQAKVRRRSSCDGYNDDFGLLMFRQQQPYDEVNNPCTLRLRQGE